MCGIVGYVGHQESVPLLLRGLKRLEYRGYDSAGLALLGPNGLDIERSVGRVGDLESKLSHRSFSGCHVGIAHTRWATHGRPSEANAHPHCDASGRIALVHNGVIENHAGIRKFLEGQGIAFESETDTEALAQLIGFFYEQTGDLLESVRSALLEVQGTFGLALICSELPETLIAARRGSPLLIGKGQSDYFVASDASPFLDQTSNVTYLDDDEIICVRPDGLEAITIDAKRVEKSFCTLDWVLEEFDMQGFQHHMHKEIHEQPESLRNVFRGRLDSHHNQVVLGGLSGFERDLARAKRVILFGCGTAWHAALVGEYLFEHLAGVPTEVEYGSELRYRNPIIEEGTLAVAISQSGETADTLAALREVKAKGALALGVVNVVGSSIARETDAGVFLHVGPEIGVASTKAFLGQVAVLAMMATDLGRRKRLPFDQAAEVINALQSIPNLIASVLEREQDIQRLAAELSEWENWLYLGRGINYPVALEGALKLKEVSYIHAEGLPAAEMKHGPIALIDEGTPVVVIATRDHTHAKVLANMEEVRSRGGRIIAIATEGDTEVGQVADDVIYVPPVLPILSPLVTTVPLQLLAYHAALCCGRDVDKPRNLAKSVTVE